MWSSIHLRKHRNIFVFSTISQNRDGTGAWNHFSWKTKTGLLCEVHAMAADGLATQGATKVPAAMVLIMMFRNITISAEVKALVYMIDWSWANLRPRIYIILIHNVINVIKASIRRRKTIMTWDVMTWEHSPQLCERNPYPQLTVVFLSQCTSLMLASITFWTNSRVTGDLLLFISATAIYQQTTAWC